ncbi:lysophospholipid acyltransferase family protein [Paraglaciecola aquimarina]|uniref:Lysophospholipid acyltransferase family protein n=1 Tax=Paraglaciecola aquimarina TaxID=1235557 RepID=A0ABU3SST0_9ALTE|nr:lysophospholipid acyltransferase family protein [Paraglaciecola aquimarina]MDU0353028.1 lysophospholipid acyltransferase family protein [Paraglaciecola aquimarina]
MKYLDRTWRLFATGFCFAMFGIGGIIIAATWLPFYGLIYKNNEAQRKKSCRYAVHLTFKSFVWLMYAVGVCKFDTKGLDKLKNLQGKILIANHPSLIDVVVLISIVRNADCIVKQNLLENVFTRGVIRNTGYISNADPEELIKDCEKSLQQGSTLIIFPEGTRTKPGTALNFRRGAANIALRCATNFQRVLIEVTPPALTKGWPWYKVPKRKIHMKLVALDEVEISPYDTGTASKSVRQLTRDIEGLFQADTANFSSIYRNSNS